MTAKRFPLMPHGTAVWLVENTSLTFKQIAEFCGLHILEVQSIANNDVLKVQGVNPILNNEVTAEEIARCQNNATSNLVFSDMVREIDMILKKGKSKRKYVYLNSRQNKLNAILWLVNNHPELSKVQIRKLVGTTNRTIDNIRNKCDIQAKDPVLTNICTQEDLNLEIEKAVTIATKKKYREDSRE